MHDQSFPESEESPEARSARAVAALEYEQSAGLGFRRRETAPGDPWAEPDRALVGQEDSNLQLLGAYIASLSVIFGLCSFFTKPLLFAPMALVPGLFGLIPSERSAKIAKAGLIIASIGFVVGMVVAITFDNAVV